MNTLGIDLRKATRHLQDCGTEITDRRLRDHLVNSGAIRKTPFGYEVGRDYRGKGLLITQTRQHRINTESGQQIARPYTVVLLTGDGLSWLRDCFGGGATPETNH